MKKTTTRKRLTNWFGYYETADRMAALINQKKNRATILALRTRKARKAMVLALCKKAKLNADQCADILESVR